MSITIRKDSISSAAALQAVTAAVAHGKSRGVAVVAAVTCPSGDTVACLRADGAFSASVSIAQDKAYTAAVFGVSTGALCAALAHNETLREGIALRPRVILFGGGLPITVEDHVVGAIGVSGGSEDDDRACAAAGLAALGLAPAA
jgi:uncharacterized protein GlcG (DUF336 family)